MIKETWMSVKEYPNYKISNYGKIYNIKTNIFLKPRDNGKGYLYVNLYKNSKTKRYYVHRLVATYFLPNPENKREVNHKNLDRTDNRAENLEWITSSENQKHKYENGDYKTSNRKVGQFDLDGNFIQEFESIIAAARSIGRSR